MPKEKKCLRCGKCCLTKGIMKQSSLIERIIYRLLMINKYGLLGIKNLECPYLKHRSRNTYCAIYENRPDFCREYYCKKIN